ncbi:DHA2 family efflux MFS transporter permease subunit [Streptomyces alboniger]|uniref:DHA2 family efflux MFS transporter permease subunit n=1 Tax=Streptomyces alboniger TaxID=132473 RepID=A0A5J6HYU7_STRAD|nr:DHA2 family efflux MFS transporter permease subunit [Streptomyces alboniger]QEV21775.1 DHA2 family efflux MFS transporter permease subunit [Streptomyces alboniger]
MAKHARPRCPWTALGVICVGFFMIVLDTTIVHVAVPAMLEDLDAGLDRILWIVNAYVLTYAVLMITAGRFGERFGPRRVYLAGLLLFTLASGLCALAESAGQLIALRAVQGVGAALLTPQTGAFVTVLFPPERRGAAFGVLTSAIGLSIVAGPLLGGFLVTCAGWQWIFLVNVPVGLAALVAAFVLLPRPAPVRRHGWDLAGLVLVTTGLTAFTFGLLESDHAGSASIAGPVTAPWVLASGLVLLSVFVLQQRRTKGRPLLPRALFAHRDFGLANLIGAGIHFAVIGSAFPVALFLQSVLGCSAWEAGLVTAPTPLAAVAVAQVAGRLVDRFGGKALLLVGLLTYAGGLALIVVLARPGMNPWGLLPGLLVADIGIGCVLAPVTHLAMNTVDSSMAGAASGVLNTTRQVGGVLGSAAVGTLLQYRLAADAHQRRLTAAELLPRAARRAFVSDPGGEVPAFLDPRGVDLFLRLGAQAQRQGFVDAMRETALLPIGVLLLGAACCLALSGGTRRSGADSG